MSGFGAFGKIPDLGDFFRHNLSSAFVKTWDSWLQAVMVESKSALAGGWDDAYMMAPIWRFTLPAGLAGETGMTGILMASVDRVGRQYPLTLAAPHHGAGTAYMHFANRSVFESLEDLALQMLDDTGRRDTLFASLETISLFDAPAQPAIGLPYVGAAPAEPALAAMAVEQRHPNASIWSTMMNNDHRLMACHGLPQGQEARALFDLKSSVWGGSHAPAAAHNWVDDLPPPLEDPIADILSESSDLSDMAEPDGQ
ncbi:MAG: type VI secretion system-associated protein TagF [Pseudomonadota bacterium]